MGKNTLVIVHLGFHNVKCLLLKCLKYIYKKRCFSYEKHLLNSY